MDGDGNRSVRAVINLYLVSHLSPAGRASAALSARQPGCRHALQPAFTVAPTTDVHLTPSLLMQT